MAADLSKTLNLRGLLAYGKQSFCCVIGFFAFSRLFLDLTVLGLRRDIAKVFESDFAIEGGLIDEKASSAE